MAFSAMSASESFSTRFPLKLWRLLNRCSSGAICWAEHGRSIRIDRRRFEREYLMPADSAFKTSNFSSFVRQLNLYGFRKVINTFRFNQPPESFGDIDLHEYHHPFFRKGHPDLLNRVQRRMKGRKAPPIRPDMDTENVSLVSSILKPLHQSTPKEHVRVERPPLHSMEMNPPVMRYVRQDNMPALTSATWSGYQGIQKPVTPSILPSTITTNQRTGIETALYTPSASRPPQTVSGNFRLHTQPTGHPGLPVVEAIHQVLGEKNLSEMVLPSSATAVNSSLYHTPPAPGFPPVLSAVCNPQKTTTLPLNIPHTSITLSPVSTGTDSLVTTPINLNSLYSLKPSVPQPGTSVLTAAQFSSLVQSIQPALHGLGSLSGSGELASLSQLSSLQDTVMPHLVNLCPPINSQVLPSPNSTVHSLAPVQGSFQSMSTSSVCNPLAHLNAGLNMPNHIQSKRFYSTSPNSTMLDLQNHGHAVSMAGNSSQLHVMPFDTRMPSSAHSVPVSAAKSTDSPLADSPACTVSAAIGTSMPPTSATPTDSSEQVLDHCEPPDNFTVGVVDENDPQSADNKSSVEFLNESTTLIDRSSPNPIAELLEDDTITVATGSCPSDASVGETEDTGKSLAAPMSLSSNTEFSLTSAGTDSITSNGKVLQDASTFLRRLSQGGIDTAVNEDAINNSSPPNQYQEDNKNSMRNQDFIMPSSIKVEME